MMNKCNQLPRVDELANETPNANILYSQFAFE